MSINTSAPLMKHKTVDGVLLKNRKHDFEFEERSFVCFPPWPAYNILINQYSKKHGESSLTFPIMIIILLLLLLLYYYYSILLYYNIS
jgi:hypothetical protein